MSRDGGRPETQRLFGREGELAAVTALGSLSGTGLRGAVLQGPPGIGKTALWRAGVANARGNGYCVLTAMPSQAEKSISFSGLGDIVQNVLDNDPAALHPLSSHTRSAILTAVGQLPWAGGPVDALTVASGIRQTFARLAAQTQVMLAVDDLHWMDDASLSVLSHALRRIDGNLAVITSLRVERSTGGATPIPTDLPDWLVPIELTALTPKAVRSLLMTQLGEAVSAEVAEAITTLAEGNPLATVELARANLAATDAFSLRIPESLTAGHLQQIAGLSPLAQQCLLLASLAVSPTVPMLQRATGAASAELERALAEASDQNLLAVSGPRLLFVHPLHSTAAVANATQAQHRAAHRALVELTANVQDRANHVDRATIGPSEEAAAALVMAAREAFNRGAASSGLTLARRALDRAPEGSPSIPSAKAIVGEVEFLNGNLIVAEQYLSEAIDLIPHEGLAAARTLLFRTIFERDANRALPYLEQAIAVSPSGEGHVNLQLWLGHLCCLQLRWADAIDAVVKAEHTARALGDEGLLAEALAGGVIVRMLAGHGLDGPRLETALALRDSERPPHPVADPLFVAACAYNFDGQHDRVIKICQSIAQLLTDREPTTHDIFALTPGISSACALGRTDVAQRFGAGGLDRPTSLPTTGFYALAGGIADAFVLSAHGDSDRAAVAVANIMSVATTSGLDLPQVPLVMARPIGAALVMTGRYQEADDQLGPLAQFAIAVDYPEPGVVAWVAEWAEALTRLGRVDEAGPALDWLEKRCETTGRYWVTGLVARGRAHIAATTGDLDGAMRFAQQAIDIFTKSSQPFETARTQLALGSFLRRRRSRRAAAEVFEQARTFFAAAQLPRFVIMVDEEIERVRSSRTAPNELTAGETAIAELAAAGRTNRAIAATLFVSEKTVEAQLSKVFKKLNISRRIELVAALAKLG
jgi:DNA-binding CsgD family transcriptional regulator